LENKIEMKKKGRRIVFWAVVAVVALLVIAVAMNWGSFAEGFEAGGRLAE
jgi:flagellar basal body-associated protein FliL